MKKILITGASGFIGSFLVEEALKRGWEVWAGVRKSSNLEFLTDPKIHFIDLNYGDLDGLKRQIQAHVDQFGRWNDVIHNAGLTKSADEAGFYRVNYEYTFNLINALINGGNTPEKFIYMSSLSALGAGDEVHYTPFKLHDTPKPNTAYGASKIKSEQYLRSLSSFPHVILRPTGVYGPRDKDYLVMVKMVKMGLDVAVGFKPQLLNFIYVKDLVEVCFSAIESPLRNKTWFVADGDVYTSQEFTKIVQEVLGKKYLLRVIVPWCFAKALSLIASAFSRLTGKTSLINPDKLKIIKQRNWTCDDSALKEDLGFEARYNLRKGVEETVDWYRNNGWL